MKQFRPKSFIKVQLAWWLSGKESSCNAGDLDSIPGLGRSPGEWQPTPIFLPGEFHGQRNLVGYSSWGHKESDTTEPLTQIYYIVLIKFKMSSIKCIVNASLKCGSLNPTLIL